MMADKESLEIYLAHGDKEVRETIAGHLKRLRHELLLEVCTGKALVQACADHTPDLVVSSFRLNDMDGVSALKQSYQFGAFPAILATTSRCIDHKIAKALEDHVMVCLTDPVREEDLHANIPLVYHRFRSLHQLWKENQRLKESLRRSKAMEQAKGILMKQHGLSLEEAARELEKMAAESRLRPSVIAQTIVDAVNYGESFHGLKAIDSQNHTR